MLNRFLYLGYYFKEMDWAKFNLFMDFISRKKGKSKVALWYEIIKNSIKYNISPLEYFNFHFYDIPAKLRAEFAGTGYMYEYQLRMNPKDKREVLENKWQFLNKYSNFVKHDFASLQELENNSLRAEALLINKSGKIVLKYIKGQCGKGVEVHRTKDFNPTSLVARMKATGNDLAEEFVMQHEKLDQLSPSGLNTLRIITQINSRDEVDILGVRLRITVNSIVDNLASGNIAAPVDIKTGKVSGKGVYSDITKDAVDLHPVTGITIPGFEVPFFAEALKMAKNAALVEPGNRSIGWDIAITNEGPELIEGNHDWCKLLWQLPAGRGLKPMLKDYLKELKAG